MFATDCIEPPALDQIELSQFADGEALQNTVTHIAKCAFCRANAEQFVHQQQGFKALLFRSTCPSSEEIRDYQMGFLDRVRDNFVALHIRSCPHCARELSQLNAYLDDPLLQSVKEPSKLLGRLQTLIGELVRPSAQPALSGIRGGDEQLQTFRIGSGQIGIEVELDDERQETLTIKGLITGIELAELSTYLWQSEQLVASEPVDEILGDFVIRGIRAGDYELTLQRPDLVIRIPSLKIGA